MAPSNQPPLDGLGVVHHVSNVVQRVEYAEHLNAVFLRARNEAIHDVFGIVLVTNQVLAAREHGQIGVGHVRLDGSQALPRILVEKTQARVKRRAAPRLNSPVAYLVHFRQDGQHIAERHAGSPQALLAVADGGVHQLQTRHASPLTFQIRPRCHGSMKADACRHDFAWRQTPAGKQCAFRGQPEPRPFDYTQRWPMGRGASGVRSNFGAQALYRAIVPFVERRTPALRIGKERNIKKRPPRQPRL